MSALDTLASQAFGAENFHLVGTWAQRGCVLLTIMCLPIGVLWVIGTASHRCHSCHSADSSSDGTHPPHWIQMHQNNHSMVGTL